jgi:hypothetical protein
MAMDANIHRVLRTRVEPKESAGYEWLQVDINTEQGSFTFVLFPADGVTVEELASGLVLKAKEAVVEGV